jgi:sterol O-acyltransferase
MVWLLFLAFTSSFDPLNSILTTLPFYSFADRQFYEDWVRVFFFASTYRSDANAPQWNSTSQAEFSRKWNKPVHMFLLRHVYASTMTSYKLSRQSAIFVTFLLSACVHELVMVVVTKKFRWVCLFFCTRVLAFTYTVFLTCRFYLFALQLIQIPLIALNSVPFIKRNKILGNMFFWLGLYAGFPLLCVAYVAY